MGHSHAGSACDHGHAELRSENRRSLLFAAFIAFLVFAAEIIGGLLSNSLALLADSGHVFVDLASLGLSIWAMWLAERPPTATKTYGYRHAETLAAFVNGLTVILLSVWIIYEALLRLRAPEPVKGGLMLGVTLIGLAGNVWAAFLLFGGQKSSINVRGAFLHIIGDILGSFAALVAATGIFLLGTTILDPIASIVVSILILYSAWGLLRRSSSLLMLSVPPHVSCLKLEESLRAIQGVTRVHDLHVWSLGEGTVAFSCHLVAEDHMNRSALLAAANQLLRSQFSISHSVIQIESAQAACPVTDSCFTPKA